MYDTAIQSDYAMLLARTSMGSPRYHSAIVQQIMLMLPNVFSKHRPCIHNGMQLAVVSVQMSAQMSARLKRRISAAYTISKAPSLAH